MGSVLSKVPGFSKLIGSENKPEKNEENSHNDETFFRNEESEITSEKRIESTDNKTSLNQQNRVLSENDHGLNSTENQSNLKSTSNITASDEVSQNYLDTTGDLNSIYNKNNDSFSQKKLYTEGENTINNGKNSQINTLKDTDINKKEHYSLSKSNYVTNDRITRRLQNLFPRKNLEDSASSENSYQNNRSPSSYYRRSFKNVPPMNTNQDSKEIKNTQSILTEQLKPDYKFSSGLKSITKSRGTSNNGLAASNKEAKPTTAPQVYSLNNNNVPLEPSVVEALISDLRRYQSSTPLVETNPDRAFLKQHSFKS